MSNRIEAEMGEHIARTARRAVALRNSSNEDVAFAFNGIEIVCGERDTPDTVEARWQEESDKAAERYRNSPEGKRSAEKAEDRRLDCQRRTDDLLERLPAIVNDQSELVKWLASLSHYGDHTGITWSKKFIVEQLEDAGYVQGLHVGRKDFDDPKIMAEYIIGQAIDCLKMGMSPHPITQKFAADYAKMKGTK